MPASAIPRSLGRSDSASDDVKEAPGDSIDSIFDSTEGDAPARVLADPIEPDTSTEAQVPPEPGIDRMLEEMASEVERKPGIVPVTEAVPTPVVEPEPKQEEVPQLGDAERERLLDELLSD